MTELFFNAVSCAAFTDGGNPNLGGTNISTIHIGEGVQRIPDHFAKTLTTIKAIYSHSTNPPVMLSNDCFSSTVFNNAALYVPYQSLENYKNTYYWNYFNKVYGVDSDGNILAEGITLNATDKSLNVGQTFKLTATVSPSVVTNNVVQWYSSNNAVATVDNAGLVTAIANGHATITATTTDGTNLSTSCDVTVTSIPVTSISLNKTSLILDISETYQLIATVYPNNATNNNVNWSTSDPAVAIVSNDGLITPVAPGDVTITVTSSDGTNISASSQVKVVKRIKTLLLNESNLTIIIPETAQLVATITPSDATNPSLNWTSSKTSVATVDNNGNVSPIAVGTTTIKVTTTDGSNLSASCSVTVIKQNVASIILSESGLVMNIGESTQLTANVVPDNASNKTLTWSSGNTSIATVDNNGLVTAIAEGSTSIIAKATDGSNVSARCDIEVLPDYYLTLDTLSHIRGESVKVVDLSLSLANKNAISGLQFDIHFPDSVSLNEISDDVFDIWLDDARKTRTHSVNANQITDGYGKSYRVLVSSSSSKDLKGNDGALVHMNLLLRDNPNAGNYPINVYNIVASESDETRHDLSNTHGVVKCCYIVGDADANAVVDIADYTATASKILGKSPSPFYYDAANVDANGSLDVVDLVGITNIALEIKPITIRQVPVRGVVENRLISDILRINAAGEGEINIGIDFGFDFAGFQMDMILPYGIALIGLSIGEGISRMGLATETMPDGKIRILGISFSDAIFNGDCPTLLTLKVRASDGYVQGSNVEFSNILFSERNMTAHQFDGSCIEFVEPSSIYELTGTTKIYVENGRIIVDTPVAGQVQLIAVDGNYVSFDAHIGRNEYPVTSSGIFIVKFNEKTLKVRL